MDSSKAILFIALLLLVFGGAWLIFDESPRPLPPIATVGDGSPGVAVLSKPAEAIAPKVAQSSAQDPEASPTESQSEAQPAVTRVAQGRTVKVVDTDDNPIAGVRVHYLISEEERWRKQFDAMKEKVELVKALDHNRQTEAAESKVSDHAGLIDLPLTGVGLVSADSGTASNIAVVEPYEEGTEQQIILQLEPYSRMAVRVVQPDGSPAANQVVRLQASDRSKVDAPGQSWARWTPIRSSIPTDADGRTNIRLDLEPLLDMGFLRIDDPVYQLSIFGMSAPLLEQRVDVDTTEEVVLTLPAHGVIQVQMQGFPASMVPQVGNLNAPERRGFFNQLKATTEEPVDGIWTYEQVPLGSEYAVNVVYHYQQDAWLTANLVNENGEEFPNGLSSDGLSAWIWAPPNYMTAIKLQNEIGHEGSLVTKAPQSHKPEQLALPFSRVIFEYNPMAQWGRRNPGFDEYRYAVVDLPAAEPGKPYELGDVKLLPLDDLLQVEVVDIQGQPIPNAKAEVDYHYFWGSGDNIRDTWRGVHYLPHDMKTDDDGSLSIYGPSWQFACNINKVYYPDKEDFLPEEFRLKVSHADYQTVQIDFQPTDRKLRAVLQQAASVTGSVLKSEHYSRISVCAVKPGTPTVVYGQEPDFLGWARVERRTPKGESALPFTLTGLPPEPCDIIFLEGDGGSEFHRIPSVPTQVGSTRPGVLQDIDLLPFLDFVELEVIDENGVRVGGDALASTFERIMRFSPDFRSGSGTATTIRDDRLCIHMAKGTKYFGTLRGDGFAQIKLDGLEAGVHVVHLNSLPRIVRADPRRTGHVEWLRNWCGRIHSAHLPV